MSKDLSHPVHKVSVALFVFLLLVASIFDLLAILPLMGTLISFFFMTIVKLSLAMSGYHAGILRMIIVFIILIVFETILSPIPSCIFYVGTFYIFNNRLYLIQQKLIASQQAAVTQT